MNTLCVSPADTSAVSDNYLVLVNSDHAMPRTFTPVLVPVCGQKSILMEVTAARALEALIRKIDGWDSIVPVSGWRSRKEQQQIWDDSMAENGLLFTQTYVAYPDHSEHQTGLAIDLGLKQDHIDFIRPDFPYSGICQIFRDLAADYGFIERYPAGKESVTGIGHEPWHFRYVGLPHAEIIKEQGLTLEEYLQGGDFS